MSFLQSAHHFTVNKLSIATSSPALPEIIRPQNPRDILYSRTIHGAMHDSSERRDAPKCQPETRKAVQEEIISWITDGDADQRPSKILWLTGPAGSGKTAIAGSVAEICEQKGLLAATLFFSSFSGSVDGRSKRGVVATLVHQLSQVDGYWPFWEEVLATIERNPAVFDKNLKGQLDALVLRPLREVGKTHSQILMSPRVVIIDGLDEILAATTQDSGPDQVRQESEGDQVEVLTTLLNAANDPSFPFRIIVSSRPERVIRDFFACEARDLSRELFLDEKYSPDADISLFLQSNIAKIRRRYTLPRSWPGDDALSILVRNASGQFIYAATVVRFLHSGAISPQVRMEFIKTLRSDDKDNDPFAPLNALYHHILRSSPQPILAIQWISVISSKLSGSPAQFTKQLLQEYQGQGDYLLENLALLIWVLSPGDEGSYKLYHKSLLDFLSDPQRCGAEFHHAYRSAVDQLLFPRCGHVFQKQSPATPLRPGVELETFHSHFIANLLGAGVCGAEYMEWERAKNPTSIQISSLWSMHTTVLDFAVHFPANHLILSRQMSIFFQFFHKCYEKNRPGICTPSCKHWRSRILQSCQALGWKVPSAPHLLRELLYEGWLHPRGKGATPGPRNEVNMFSGDFEPPEAPISPPLPPVTAYFAVSSYDPFKPCAPVKLVCPALGSACDGDHEALLKLVNAVYSWLSEGWHNRFDNDLSRDVLVQHVFRRHVGRICQEFLMGCERSEVDEDAEDETSPLSAPPPTSPIGKTTIDETGDDVDAPTMDVPQTPSPTRVRPGELGLTLIPLKSNLDPQDEASTISLRDPLDAKDP